MTTTKRRRPETCGHCGEPIEYMTDHEGVWAECACDAGYLA